MDLALTLRDLVIVKRLLGHGLRRVGVCGDGGSRRRRLEGSLAGDGRSLGDGGRDGVLRLAHGLSRRLRLVSLLLLLCLLRNRLLEESRGRAHGRLSGR